MDRDALRADCSRCVALCCTVLGFTRSDDFAIDKPAGVPCPRLQSDLRCGIHAHLRDRGFAGCSVYDCFGAGQRVSEQVYPGRDGRRDPQVVGDMGVALLIMEQLHAMLWYLADATDALQALDASPRRAGLDGGDEESGEGADRTRADPPADLRGRVDRAVAQVQELAAGGAEEIVSVPVGSVQRHVDALLDEVSATVRTGTAGGRGGRLQRGQPAGDDRAGADLRGADLRGADLRGVNFRNADLRNADLRGADLAGADLRATVLRAADVRGARLVGALYLTVGQLRAARGDRRTLIPAHLDRPAHWSAARPSRPG